MDIIDREVVWNEVFEVWNTLDLVFDDLRNFFFEGRTTLRHIYEILWILGRNKGFLIIERHFRLNQYSVARIAQF